MNTGTPNSNARTRSNPHRPHAARIGNIARQIAAAPIAAFALAIVATALLLVPPPAQAQMVTNNALTGLPGIVDQANPNDTLSTLRPGMTLEAVTSGIMDADGLTNPNWMYQWAHKDASNTVTDISGVTQSTYLIEDDDIGKKLEVKVTFEDDEMNSEGPLVSPPTQFVGPTGLIVWNTPGDPALRHTESPNSPHNQVCPRISSRQLSPELHAGLRRTDPRQHR